MRVVTSYIAALVCAGLFSFILAGCWVGFANVSWTWPMRMSEEMLQAFLRILPFLATFFGMWARSIQDSLAEPVEKDEGDGP